MGLLQGVDDLIWFDMKSFFTKGLFCAWQCENIMADFIWKVLSQTAKR